MVQKDESFEEEDFESEGIIDDTEEPTEGQLAAAAAAKAAAINENARFPGDTLKDRKTGRKARFVNEYGTNGRAVIVIPEGQTRSELWDASTVEIIKKVKRIMPVEQEPVLTEEDMIFSDDDDVQEDTDE